MYRKSGFLCKKYVFCYFTLSVSIVYIKNYFNKKLKDIINKLNDFPLAVKLTDFSLNLRDFFTVRISLSVCEILCRPLQYLYIYIFGYVLENNAY